MLRATFILACCFAFTGCEHTKSFLHMNSDSPSPFFGLQLAVDRNTPAVQLPAVPADQDISAAEFADQSVDDPTAPERADTDQTGIMLAGTSSPNRRPRFSFTTSTAALTGDVKMALPELPAKPGTPTGDEAALILEKLRRLR